MNNQPQPEKISIASTNIYRNTNVAPDYRQKFSEPHIDVGLAELLGGRSTQEDNVSVTQLLNFSKLSKDEQKKFWQASFAEMSKQIKSEEFANRSKEKFEKKNGQLDSFRKSEYKDPSKDQGSCAIASVSYVKHEKNKSYACVSTANLGDSSVFVARRNKVTGKITCERINTNLHKPDDGSEAKRINENGKGFASSGGGRVNYLVGKDKMSTLAVARAWGDLGINQGKKDVISTEPGIDHNKEKEYELSDKEDVFVITACDGLTEADINKERLKCKSGETKGADAKLVEMLLTDILKENPTCSTDLLAQKLAEAARDKCESHDNISVIARKMTKDSAPVMTAVFDGHGGAEISEYVAEKFPIIVQQQLTLALQQQTGLAKKNTKSFNPSALSAYEFDDLEPVLPLKPPSSTNPQPLAPPTATIQPPAATSQPLSPPIVTSQPLAPPTSDLPEWSPQIARVNTPPRSEDQQARELVSMRQKFKEFEKTSEGKKIDSVITLYNNKAKRLGEDFGKIIDEYKNNPKRTEFEKSYIGYKAEQIKNDTAGLSINPDQTAKHEHSHKH